MLAMLQVVSKPHHTLVTLLLCNAVALEVGSQATKFWQATSGRQPIGTHDTHELFLVQALPIFLDRLVDPVAAVVLSVTVVLFFGEIVPQAICSHYGLAIGAWTAWFVRFLMAASSPISWPISKLLDYLLGSEHTVRPPSSTALFRRGQLKALVDLHSETEGLGGQLAAEEINVIRGALDLTSKTAAQGMTPLGKVRMLSADEELNEDTLRGILLSGHSRVPVHRPGNRKELLGIILVKELVLIDNNARTRVADLRMRSLPYLRADTAMYDLLKLFQTGRSHMVVLTQPPDAADGSVSRANSQDVTVQIEEARERVSPEKQALLHEQSKQKGKADAPPVNGTSGPGSDGSEADEAGSSRDRGEQWPSDQTAEPNEPVGIITIEDVLEELIGQEILDETDQFVDNEMRHAVNTANLVKDLPPQLRNALKLRQGLSRSRSGRITVSGSLTDGNIVLATGKNTGKPSPRRKLGSSRPSSSVVVSRKTGASNQTMDILEPLMQSPQEHSKH
ncbi:hypothetical protein ABBQ38_007384 [Trebouxia sp. C0009 RCD-2024]